MRLKCRDGSPLVENLSNRRDGFRRACILRGFITTNQASYLVWDRSCCRRWHRKAVAGREYAGEASPSHVERQEPEARGMAAD